MIPNLVWEKTCSRISHFHESLCASITASYQKIALATNSLSWFSNGALGRSPSRSIPSTFRLRYVGSIRLHYPSILKVRYINKHRSHFQHPHAHTHTYINLQMQAELTKYAEYYKTKHSGHVLEWDHSLGTVVLKAKFDRSVHELSVSMYQALVLLLFNEEDEIAYKDIKAQTNMSMSFFSLFLYLGCSPPSSFDSHLHFMFNALPL